MRRYPPLGNRVETSSGLRIHVLTMGSGPDLVMLHGAGGNIRDFTLSIADRLAERYRVILLDRPGFGYSDALPKQADTPAAQAECLRDAAQRLGAERPLVLGHSYGGTVALAWGLLGGAAGLVILSGVTMPWLGGVGPLYDVMASPPGNLLGIPLVAAFATRREADVALERIFAPQPVPAGYVEDFGLALTLRRVSLRANVRQVAALRAHVAAMCGHYGTLTLPVAVIHGTRDQIVPHEVHAVPLAEMLPQGELALLRRIGHMPHHAAPEAVAKAVDRLASRAGIA